MSAPSSRGPASTAGAPPPPEPGRRRPNFLGRLRNKRLEIAEREGCPVRDGRGVRSWQGPPRRRRLAIKRAAGARPGVQAKMSETDGAGAPRLRPAFGVYEPPDGPAPAPEELYEACAADPRLEPARKE